LAWGSVIGASIGKHCVIGSNAVVTKDIPDYCVAIGIPARIIKRYNPEVGKWLRTNPDGSFKEIKSSKI
jgi:acetyltransferase-like isoleucine patch superfamily enzyme